MAHPAAALTLALLFAYIPASLALPSPPARRRDDDVTALQVTAAGESKAVEGEGEGYQQKDEIENQIEELTNDPGATPLVRREKGRQPLVRREKGRQHQSESAVEINAEGSAITSQHIAMDSNSSDDKEATPLPYAGMECQTNDHHSAWRSGNSCTSEVLNADVTSWGDGQGVHFSSWAKIDLTPTYTQKQVLSSAEVFYYTGQTCAFDVQYATWPSINTWTTACTLTSTSSGSSTCSTGFPSSGISYLRVFKNSDVPCWRQTDTFFRLCGVKLYSATSGTQGNSAPAVSSAPSVSGFTSWLAGGKCSESKIVHTGGNAIGNSYAQAVQGAFVMCQAAYAGSVPYVSVKEETYEYACYFGQFDCTRGNGGIQSQWNSYKKS